MLKLINVTAFMVSFALGVFLVYTLEPTKQHVWIYASPKNASEIQFKAPSTDKCYDPVITNASCSLFAQDVDSEPSWFANATTFV